MVRLKECPLAYGQLEGEESAYLSHCTALAGFVPCAETGIRQMLRWLSPREAW